MRLNLNWVQRALLIVAGLFLLLFAFGTVDGYDGDAWLGTFLFLAAVVCFVLSAASRSRADG
jgi:hypothetical protein